MILKIDVLIGVPCMYGHVMMIQFSIYISKYNNFNADPELLDDMNDHCEHLTDLSHPC